MADNPSALEFQIPAHGYRWRRLLKEVTAELERLDADELRAKKLRSAIDVLERCIAEGDRLKALPSAKSLIKKPMPRLDGIIEKTSLVTLQGTLLRGLDVTNTRNLDRYALLDDANRARVSSPSVGIDRRADWAFRHGITQDLLRRGLSFEQGILCVIDGSKGLKKAVSETFGEHANSA